MSVGYILYTSLCYEGAAVKFDISHRPGVAQALRFGRGKNPDGVDGENEEITMKTSRPREWELDVRSLISSKRWLQNYGLKKNRLQLNQILPSIGFKLSDDFDETLKRPVSSRYGGGLFRQMLHPDGRTFNISCSKDKLLQLEKRLLQAMYLFRRRLEWLTTESRRTFGVIEERSVTIVLDIRNMSPQQFDQYRTALERVLREQVSQLAKFNLISEESERWSSAALSLSLSGSNLLLIEAFIFRPSDINSESDHSESMSQTSSLPSSKSEDESAMLSTPSMLYNGPAANQPCAAQRVNKRMHFPVYPMSHLWGATKTFAECQYKTPVCGAYRYFYCTERY
ncbi:von Willebrand factor A domain-containing protein 3B [Elysia marginata]|uniref:von Willebrand factor A domain-containing protein 3B n=1 Tax=Elysia marginata TaxID=1093978 RepID=A0AAV4EDC8_9GAST|nr:von Willebrand factor A domain-containing protein 3B [Elysia marginata]